MLPAATAAVRHRSMILALGDMDGAAVGADNPVGPAFLLKVQAGRFFVGEPLEELIEARG